MQIDALHRLAVNYGVPPHVAITLHPAELAFDLFVLDSATIERSRTKNDALRQGAQAAVIIGD